MVTNPMEFYDNITAVVAINRKHMIVTNKLVFILWLTGIGTFNTWMLTSETES